MGVELHSGPPPTTGKKLWNILRIAFFMMRKGFSSKRKLIMDMNLMMQRGKLLGRTSGNNITFSSPSPSNAFGLHEYEFSCSNSPNPTFLRANVISKRKHGYFSCMGAGPADEERPDVAEGPTRIESSPKSSMNVTEEGDGEVDDRAEEFIRRFYQQLDAQGQIALLQYQEELY